MFNRTITPEEQEAVDLHGGKVGVAMVLHRNRAEAHKTVDRVMDELERVNQEPLLDTPLISVLDTLTANALERQLKFKTVGELLHSNIAHLAAIPQLGPNRILGALQAVALFAITRAIELERQQSRGES